MKKYIDFITIPIGLLLYYLMNEAGNYFDIHMMGYEPLQKMGLAIAELLILIGFAMLILKVKFPTPFSYIDKEFKINNGWDQLTKKEITFIGFALFSLIVLSLVILTANQ